MDIEALKKLMDELTITKFKTASLIPYINNARTHSEEQVLRLVGSIRQYGFVNPILVGEDRVIIAGHCRLMAAQRLGLENVPVIILPHLTEDERHALVIADNKIAEDAGWNDYTLSLEIQKLRANDFPLESLGMPDKELERLMNFNADEAKGLTDDDAAPEVTEEEAVSQIGDVWICGEHKVMCGDALILTDIEKLMDNELADMVFTDPPYNVNYGAAPKDALGSHSAKKPHKAIMNDNLGNDFGAFLYDAFVNMMIVNKGASYICMSSSELDTLQKAFREAGGKWSTFVIWAKNTFTLGRSDYQRQYEPILYGWKNGADHFWCGDRNQGDVWQVNKPTKNDLHPTMKPVELVERAIKNSSKTRDIVLDCFGGSGSTMIAAEKTGRRARLIELDPKYVDVIVKRWEAYTGKEAKLLK